jgi:glycosyltransferase involved in cell wall biosynthesis
MMNSISPNYNNLDSVWVVVAAYNEGRAVTDVVIELKDSGFKVVLVDDGSDDETAAMADAAGAVVVKHPINLGQGAALQTGINFALRREAEFIVTFDADGQHLVSDIPALLSALIDSGADIACGSRFLGRAENLSKVRRAILKLATLFTFITTGMRMTDAHNGLRAMTRSCAMRIRIRQNRMAHASEIIAEIARHRLIFVEVPVTIRYSAYSLQKGQKLSNSINIILDLIARGLYR